MTALSAAVREALSAVNAPGVHLPPWRIATDDGGGDSARKKSIGIRGGCCIEHDHDADDGCVLIEFAVVWNNDTSLPAEHPDNAREVATAKAMVAAFNLMSRHGEAILRAVEVKL